MTEITSDGPREPDALSRWAIRGALAIADVIPPRAARLLARGIGAIQFRMDRVRREAVLANLRGLAAAGHPLLATSSDRSRAARAIFVSYHRFLLEFLAQRRLTAGSLGSRFRLHGMEVLYRALAAGRGAIVAAPHLGNWELAGLALARLGFRVHVVTGVQLHPLLSAAVRALKESSGMRVSTPEDGFAPLLATLREGGLVVLLVDGDVYARALDATFFGRATPFPAGPAILARRARAPLLHAHAEREGDGTHRISIDGLDRPDRALSLERDLTRLTERVARAQERNIATHVTQWCIFRPFFPPAAGAGRSHAA